MIGGYIVQIESTYVELTVLKGGILGEGIFDLPNTT